MRNSILILLLLLSGLAGFAQQEIEEDPDPKRKPDSPQVAVPWAHIRQADAIYRKRIWRIIDVREII